MTWLVAIGLTNAAMASLLACVAWAVGRSFRRPALTRLLWIIVLCKLLAPPLAKAPPSWLAVPSRWIAETTAEPPAVATTITTADAVAQLDGDGSADEPRNRQTTSANHDSQPARQGTVTASARTPTLSEDLPSAAAGSPGRSGQDALGPLLAFSPAACLRWSAIVWISGSALFVVWLAWRSWRFRNFLAHAGRIDAKLSRRVSRLAKEAGLRSAPQVLVVDSPVSPMLWGAGGKARLLFPAELARRIDDEARDSLLLHELAHYARADWLVRVLELAVQVAYWWHPLVWWARHEIEAAEEECCDAWVVSRQSGSRRAYAEALLTTLDFLCEPIASLPPAACGLGAAPLLRSRLTQIMCGNVAIHPSRTAKAMVLAGAACVLPWGPAFVGPAPQEAAANVVKGPTETYASTMMLPPTAAVPPAVEPAALELDSIEPTPLAEPRSASWFIAQSPLTSVSQEHYATAVSPNGKHKLELRTGYRVTLIDVETESHLDLSSYRILSASFSPDSRRFVTAQEDDNVVRLWDASSGELLARLNGSDVAVTSVAFGPDGKRVAAGAEDGSVLVWHLADWDLARWEQVARLAPQDAPVSCLRWSRQGDRLAIALSSWSNRDSSSLVVWAPREGTRQTWPLEQSIGAIDWMASDEVVLGDWSGAKRSIDLTTGRVAENQGLAKDKDAISAAAFSPDCPLLPRWQAGRLARADD